MTSEPRRQDITGPVMSDPEAGEEARRQLSKVIADAVFTDHVYEALDDIMRQLAELSAEHIVIGMEAGAERDGESHLDCDGLRLSVTMCESPDPCDLRPYHYFAPVAGKPMPASRETLLALIAEKKCAQVQR